MGSLGEENEENCKEEHCSLDCGLSGDESGCLVDDEDADKTGNTSADASSESAASNSKNDLVGTQGTSIVLEEENEAGSSKEIHPDRPEAQPSDTAVHSKATPSRSTGILSLPMDALHGIASFLTPAEWCEFGVLNRASKRVCREIVRRAYMHGFKCATEVAAAWKLGHHEDAKELAALYVSEGVPVYPRSLGHSYHTLLWRMQAEARELSQEDSSFQVDPFYQSRGEFRSNDGINPEMTYLELKSLFWMQKDDTEDAQPRRSLASLGANSPTVQHLLESRVQLPAAGGSTQELPTHKTKIAMNIHQHLLDQHLHARECADDQEGTLVAPPFSLSADFYHPQSRRRSSRVRFGNTGELARSPVPDFNDNLANLFDAVPFGQNLGQNPPFGVAARRLQRQLPIDGEVVGPHLQCSPFKDHPVLDFLDLEVYSAASIPGHKSQENVITELRLHSRFETYQHRLEAFFVRGDNVGFEECMLDFWDEMFPHTAGIQYYDRHTAVPRISRLQEFLTKPCPKAIGIVQCEIERIKTTSRGKGVNMKGRLFPTYEYRLFIRNRPHNPLAENAMLEDEDFVRRDTLLMVAKNRGRRHTESSGVVSISSPKKGSNNYFLQMPQQIDVDAHFNKVNRDKFAGKMNPNGASHEHVLASNDTGNALLGRLQSNFIGTEFQIFVPRLGKHPFQKASAFYSPSDDDLDYDSGVSSDNNSSRRTRFSRLSLRRPSASTDAVLEEGSARNRTHFLRTTSSPEISQQTRHGRANRRAIANTPETQQQQQQPQRTVLCEEEDGVITYTANLLGSRPRIMDVCIPKLAPNGVTGTEWKRHLESCCEDDDCDMLTCFRQLLQQVENQEQNIDPEGEESDGEETTSVNDYGLLALQNRPPWWNIELGSFVLNFGGRVSVASVKNFQLCYRDDQDNILLQFGRIQGRHSFTMDFQHPLTAVQAFSIAISSLQSKISFG